MFELDHLFVLSDPGAPEADVLVAAGLIEGPCYVHQGQGTSNRLFFFNDFYLEFLWVHDEAEACSSRTAPTQLWERWSQRKAGASSLGLCLRPSRPEFAAQKPFIGFEYRPLYLPEKECIWIAEQSLAAPMMFYFSSAIAPRSFLASALRNAQQLNLQIETPAVEFLDLASCCRDLDCRLANAEGVTLELGKGVERELLLSTIPLVIRY